MRKFIKIALIAILFLAVAGGGALYYFTKVKKYDVADEKVDKIVEDPYSISFPEGTPLPEDIQKDEEGLVVVDKKGDFVLSDGSTMSTDEWFSSSEYKKAIAAGTPTSVGTATTTNSTADSETGSGDAASNTASAPSSTGTSGSGSSAGNASIPGGSNTSGSSGPGTSAGGDSGSGRSTAATIKSRYSSSFDSLQGQAQSQLGALVGQAKSEYEAKKAAGETVNPAYFYQKYNGAASGVEAKTDAAFDSLYKSMTSELKANGLSTSAADEYKAQYEATKEGLRNELMSKVTGG
ncbi:hypothetical protein [Domibacillus sp.]|uniref:hypothetical protein n=1 Tax=Domibacillus sp. TaxID=1969783 RepID=UPI002810C21B|nr:hypothetical protein [Domibacillus sp.]